MEDKKKELIKVDRAAPLVNKIPQETSVSEKQAASIAKYISNMRYGVTAVAPLTCKGEDCIFASKCPLLKNELPVPIGENCPVEETLLEIWIADFIRDSGMNPDTIDSYHKMLLHELANHQLLESRASQELADNPQIQQRIVVGKDDRTGEPLYSYQLNNLVHFMEKNRKQKLAILKELIATQKSRIEAGRTTMDAREAAVIRANRIKEVLGKMDKLQNIQEAEFTITQEETEDFINEL